MFACTHVATSQEYHHGKGSIPCLCAMKFATYQSSPVIKIAMDTAVGISLHELLHFLDI